MAEQKLTKAIGIDGNWYLHRAYSIAGEHDPLDQVAKLFVSMVCRDAMRTRCKRILVAFDGDDIFRYKLDPLYKANRKDKEPTKGSGNKAGAVDTTSKIYTHSLPHLVKVLDILGIKWVQKRDLEADDVLASTADHATYIFVVGTKDKDGYQILRPGVSIHDSTAKPEPRTITHKDAEKSKGVPCSKMVMYQTLLGDKIDNIPGFDGLGPKKVQAICLAHDSIKAWYKVADEKDRKFLVRNAERLKLNRKLVLLVRDQPEEPAMVPKDSPSRWPLAPNSLHDYVQFLYPKTRGLF